VLGGGAIGLELSQVMARFGVQVTVIEGSDRLLAMEEPESSDAAAEALARDGVKARTGVRAKQVSTATASSPSSCPTARSSQPRSSWSPPAAPPARASFSSARRSARSA
jgi:pyruvate/2-oxoglutarate dehydrogenase complex dihydrolipoamide dehydrogenase (E3) component